MAVLEITEGRVRAPPDMENKKKLKPGKDIESDIRDYIFILVNNAKRPQRYPVHSFIVHLHK